MRSAVAGLIALAGDVFAHPDHGAPEGHFHGLGPEHFLLFAVVLAFLVYAVKK